jgi:hypothetical protein
MGYGLLPSKLGSLIPSTDGIELSSEIFGIAGLLFVLLNWIQQRKLCVLLVTLLSSVTPVASLQVNDNVIIITKTDLIVYGIINVAWTFAFVFIVILIFLIIKWIWNQRFTVPMKRPHPTHSVRLLISLTNSEDHVMLYLSHLPVVPFSVSKIGLVKINKIDFRWNRFNGVGEITWNNMFELRNDSELIPIPNIVYVPCLLRNKTRKIVSSNVYYVKVMVEQCGFIELLGVTTITTNLTQTDQTPATTPAESTQQLSTPEMPIMQDTYQMYPVLFGMN